MEKRITDILAKTPLFFRVVSLYVVLWPVGTYIFSIATPPPSPVAAIALAQIEPVIQPVKIEEVRGVSRKIELPRIGLVEEVIDGGYDENTSQWTLTEDKVQWANMTTSINNVAGQTLLYGHNTEAVLEPVKNLQVGDELYVTTDTGHVFVYVYTSDRFVVPTDIAVLYESPDTPRVALMTCEGWLSETRRLLYFDLKEVR